MLFAAALGLLAAAPAHAKSADGHTYSNPEYHRTEFRVKLVEYDSIKELRQVAKEYGLKREEVYYSLVRRRPEINAFALLKNSGEICEIHILNLTIRYQAEWLGHELAHCIGGRWHE